VWWSRDRGCKGHRILRRVLVGGRHLRLSRATFLHGCVVTATLAASSHEKGEGNVLDSERPNPRTSREGAADVLGEEGEATEVSEARSLTGTVGRKRPRSALATRSPGRVEETEAPGKSVSVRIRRSVLKCRETLGPPVEPFGAQTPRAARAAPSKDGGLHAMKVAERAGNARRYGCT